MDEVSSVVSELSVRLSGQFDPDSLGLSRCVFQDLDWLFVDTSESGSAFSDGSTQPHVSFQLVGFGIEIQCTESACFWFRLRRDRTIPLTSFSLEPSCVSVEYRDTIQRFERHLGFFGRMVC